MALLTLLVRSSMDSWFRTVRLNGHHVVEDFEYETKKLGQVKEALTTLGITYVDLTGEVDN